MRVRLKECRERRLLTQAELAARIGVTVGTINRIERGVHQPRLRTFRCLAAALDVSPDDLVVWDDSQAEKEAATPQQPGAQDAMPHGDEARRQVRANEERSVHARQHPETRQETRRLVVAVVDLLPDPATGERRQKRVCAKTRHECEERMAALFVAPNTGAAVAVDKTMVASFVERWLASNEANVKPSTARCHRDLLRLHVLPAIGAMPLGRITPLHVQELHATWRAKGLSPTSCYHAHSILHRAFP